MVSVNKLTGSGKTFEDYEKEEQAEELRLTKLTETEDEGKKKKLFADNVPVWMYHKDCLDGQIIKTVEELKECYEAGWVDHPGKCKSLPGHKKLFKEK